ncbi:hypothetical protein X907_2683 [Glycocaulis alkaliphilus]|uniref:Uncharacterized protein n=1 Tax=Glycocaulis alkaliphilus TaxID=1434191 RepID=A0A3T0ED29_9PROT|nr:hypothetical protein [Glycocaulis alkaliphilus]AZU05194.1 hypothetical protein X907_2683 [Glycocaulis alkaliphilus]
MAREIDDRKKKKALRRLDRVRRALAEAEADGDTEAAQEARALLTEWEDEFLGSVEERLNTFGSAFTDPEKGSLDEPLSQLQAAKLKELEAKAKGKETRPWKRSSFKPKERAQRSSFSARRPARARTPATSMRICRQTGRRPGRQHPARLTSNPPLHQRRHRLPRQPRHRQNPAPASPSSRAGRGNRLR